MTARDDAISNLARVMAVVGDSLEAHADRDGLTGIDRGIFLARGGHAVGTRCPNEPPEDLHEYWCATGTADDCNCPRGGLR